MAGDPFYSSVSLLLHCDGTNGSTTFTDNSPSPKTVTANGNAQISTAQSQFGGASALFDGTGDYLSTPFDSGLSIGTSDFTIEFFVYLAGNSAIDGGGAMRACVWSSYNSGVAANGYAVIIHGTSTTTGAIGVYLDVYNSSVETVIQTAAALSQGVWHHIAICRSGSNNYIFYDGVSQTLSSNTVTSSTTINVPATQTSYVGHTPLTSLPWDINGYIDDFRITKGVARYTANFTPPTEAFGNSLGVYGLPVSVLPSAQLDPYYANTVLSLHCDGANGSTTFTDTSPSPKTVSAVGNAQISTAQSQFGGASALFDGTGDYLTIPSNAGWQFGGGDWTIEAWIYRTVDTATGDIMACRNAASTQPFWLLRRNAGGAIRFDHVNTGSVTVTDVTTTQTTAINTWNHVAVCRISGVVSIYINGALATLTGTNSTTAYGASAAALLIGSGDTSDSWAGNIDDVRITKGVARYTANFTPPTGPNPDSTYPLTATPTLPQIGQSITVTPTTPYLQFDPYYSSVSLLLHCNGANASTTFVDHSISPKTVTGVGNAQISTAQSKFDGASALFDGSGDYIDVTDNAALELGSGNFTLEAWIYPTAFAANNGGTFSSTIMCKYTASNRAFNVFISGTSTSFTSLNFVISTDGALEQSTITASTTFSLNTWYHIAVTRASGTLYLFSNGVLLNTGGTAYAHTVFNGTAPVRIGALDFDATYKRYFTGNIDDVRITNGVARYTANFTPPAAPLPDMGGVVLAGIMAVFSGGASLPNSAVPQVGQSSTASQGTVAQLISQALAGSAATTTIGSALSNSAIPQTGQAITLSKGTFAEVLNGLFFALTGQQTTLTPGSTKAAVSAALSGIFATAQSGGLTVFSASVAALTGLSVSAVRGALQELTAAYLNGMAAATNSGGVGFVKFAPLSGVSTSLVEGHPVATHTFGATGYTITLSKNGVGVGIPLTKAATLTASSGLIKAIRDKAITGSALSLSAGAVVKAASRLLTGQTVTFSQGHNVVTLSKSATGQTVFSGKGQIVFNTSDVKVSIQGNEIVTSQGNIYIGADQWYNFTRVLSCGTEVVVVQFENHRDITVVQIS
jgi:hypothetical protein